eukprot:9099633-Pyramimonas_sp.AAC.1
MSAISFSGSEPTHVKLLRGMKHGSPLSGLIFSPRFDPAARKLQEHRLSSMFPPDELAASPSDLTSVLPRIVRVLAQSGG